MQKSCVRVRIENIIQTQNNVFVKCIYSYVYFVLNVYMFNDMNMCLVARQCV